MTEPGGPFTITSSDYDLPVTLRETESGSFAGHCPYGDCGERLEVHADDRPDVGFCSACSQILSVMYESDEPTQPPTIEGRRQAELTKALALMDEAFLLLESLHKEFENIQESFDGESHHDDAQMVDELVDDLFTLKETVDKNEIDVDGEILGMRILEFGDPEL